MIEKNQNLFLCVSQCVSPQQAGGSYPVFVNFLRFRNGIANISDLLQSFFLAIVNKNIDGVSLHHKRHVFFIRGIHLQTFTPQITIQSFRNAHFFPGHRLVHHNALKIVIIVCRNRTSIIRDYSQSKQKEFLPKNENLQEIQYLLFLMSKQEEFKCNQCLKNLSSLDHSYHMPSCRHNVCQKCLIELQTDHQTILQCGFCGLKITNFHGQALKENTVLQKKATGGSAHLETNSETSNGSSKIIGASILEDSDMLLEDLPLTTCIKSNMNPLQGAEICSVHEKPLQIICTTDLKTICPHCAIFGSHKDHKFKTVKEFNQDFEEHYSLLKMAKQQKYIIDKKAKSAELKEQVQEQITSTKKELWQKIQTKFIAMAEELKKAEAKAYDELDKHFEAITKEITSVLGQQNKIEIQFNHWEVECENMLSKIEDQKNLNDKISLLYGPLKKIDKGLEIIDKLQKRYQVQSKRIENILASVAVEFAPNSTLQTFTKVIRKNQETRKESFIAMLDKINLPITKHVIDEIGDFDDNSFITDYSKQDLSVILDGQVRKRPPNVNTAKRGNHTAYKAGSPLLKNGAPQSPKSKIMRSKSNNNLFESQIKKHQNVVGTEKKIAKNRMIQNAQARQPDMIVADFIKQDLKQVLDLSKCSLDDSNAWQYLKQVRKHRRIRGLKLCQNQITDAGFSKLLQSLGNASNLNLSHNKMTEEVLGMIIKHRDQLLSLRIINLSYNQVNDRKAKTKIDTLKKMGVIVNL